ncbi:uncharacterized protein LOC135926859 [Gordionus sp. m RMFG-2023]|uniref:uncharacterized protein LOC135926859 n=1 Tax=Gordionus sp. m RMFG-2023 TaxID=3053472 RepID=UPI0031FD18C5
MDLEIIEEETDFPFPPYKKYFKLIDDTDDKVNLKAKCLLCINNKMISFFKISSFNLKKHLKRVHDNQYSKIENHINSYNKKDMSQNIKSSSSENKQSILNFSQKTYEPTKTEGDNAIIDYVIETLVPLSTVDNPSFVKMIKTFSPSAKVMCRQTLIAKIGLRYDKMMDDIIEMLSGVSYVCTTADCCSGFRRSFLGVTAHWIDTKSLQRKSAALALRRVQGKHTFDVLAKMIIDIHKSFKIRNKVIKTITDNGRNFVKAFRMFEDKSSEIDDDFQFVDIDDILNNRAESFDYLPQHSRCACHNLNLVATVDAEKALGDRSFQIVSQS